MWTSGSSDLNPFLELLGCVNLPSAGDLEKPIPMDGGTGLRKVLAARRHTNAIAWRNAYVDISRHTRAAVRTNRPVDLCVKRSVLSSQRFRYQRRLFLKKSLCEMSMRGVFGNARSRVKFGLADKMRCQRATINAQRATVDFLTPPCAPHLLFKHKFRRFPNRWKNLECNRGVSARDIRSILSWRGAVHAASNHRRR